MADFLGCSGLRLKIKLVMCRKIVISLAALCGFMAFAAAQDLTVSGTVTDPEGYPLDGATIIVKGTTTGAVTKDERIS